MSMGYGFAKLFYSSSLSYATSFEVRGHMIELLGSRKLSIFDEKHVFLAFFAIFTKVPNHVAA